VRFSEAEALDFDERPYREYHVNDRRDSMGEYMFTGLRLAEGIDPEDFRRRFGCGPAEAYADEMKEIRSFLESGDLVLERCGRVPESGDPSPEKNGRAPVDGGSLPGSGGPDLESGRLRLSEKGIDISNRIMAVFV
jgi:coproporphyrinogen III oxidase-like Fe-S oxidoreductase